MEQTEEETIQEARAFMRDSEASKLQKTRGMCSQQIKEKKSSILFAESYWL